jgi:hypothetical protein
MTSRKLFPAWERILNTLYVDGKASKSELRTSTITISAMHVAGLISRSNPEQNPITYTITEKGIESLRSGCFMAVLRG